MVKTGLTLNRTFRTAMAWLGAFIFNKRTPLVVSWNLTFRCNQRCKYCRSWEIQDQELNTSEILNMIDSLRSMGTAWISFSGGEPLLREDLGEIIRYAKTRNIYISVNSNGSLVPGRIEELKAADIIQLSLDGPADIHDYIRGRGSFGMTLKAIKVCQTNGLSVRLQCTLSKYNLSSVDYVIDFASKFNLTVLFQPTTRMLAWSKKPNPISPPVKEYQKTIRKLIKRKKEGAPIFNSFTGLNHLYNWPSPAKMHCRAGILTCNIEPNGLILACADVQKSYLSNTRKIIDSVKYRFRLLQPIYGCSQCWCASLVELNLIFSLHPEAIFNFLR